MVCGTTAIAKSANFTYVCYTLLSIAFARVTHSISRFTRNLHYGWVTAKKKMLEKCNLHVEWLHIFNAIVAAFRARFGKISGMHPLASRDNRVGMRESSTSSRFRIVGREMRRWIYACMCVCGISLRWQWLIHETHASRRVAPTDLNPWVHNASYTW